MNLVNASCHDSHSSLLCPASFMFDCLFMPTSFISDRCLLESKDVRPTGSQSDEEKTKSAPPIHICICICLEIIICPSKYYCYIFAQSVQMEAIKRISYKFRLAQVHYLLIIIILLSKYI